MEAEDFVKSFQPQISDIDNVEVVLCAPFTTLGHLISVTANTNIRIAAQNMHWEDSGAFTGEVAPGMLKSIDCKYVVLGHSERRQYFAETDEAVNKKLKAALKANLTPIACIGEQLEDREQGKTEAVIKQQFEVGFAGLTSEEMAKTVIAYEPVWAIGTGKTATSQQAEEVCAYIRKLIEEGFGSETAQQVRIQYGGSVKSANVKELMEQPNIDGALVGGASLEPDSFAQIVKF